MLIYGSVSHDSSVHDGLEFVLRHYVVNIWGNGSAAIFTAPLVGQLQHSSSLSRTIVVVVVHLFLTSCGHVSFDLFTLARQLAA